MGGFQKIEIALPAFITNIKGIAESISVSPDGSRHAVGMHRRVDIWSIDTAGVEDTIDIKVKQCSLFSPFQIPIENFNFFPG